MNFKRILSLATAVAMLSSTFVMGTSVSAFADETGSADAVVADAPVEMAEAEAPAEAQAEEPAETVDEPLFIDLGNPDVEMAEVSAPEMAEVSAPEETPAEAPAEEVVLDGIEGGEVEADVADLRATGGTWNAPASVNKVKTLDIQVGDYAGNITSSDSLKIANGWLVAKGIVFHATLSANDTISVTFTACDSSAKSQKAATGHISKDSASGTALASKDISSGAIADNVVEYKATEAGTYYFAATVSGTTRTAVKSITITPGAPAEPHTVSINENIPAGGTFTFVKGSESHNDDNSTSMTLNKDDTYTLTVTPDKANFYTLESVTATSGILTSTGDNTYSYKVVGDGTINITYKQGDPISFATITSDHGTVELQNADGTPANKDALTPGTTYYFAVAPSSGWAAASATVDGAAVTAGADGRYAFTSAAAGGTVAIAVTYKEVPVVILPTDSGYTFAGSGKFSLKADAQGGAFCNYKEADAYTELSNGSITLHDTSSTLRAEVTLPMPASAASMTTGSVTISGTFKGSTNSGKWSLVEFMDSASDNNPDDFTQAIASIRSDGSKVIVLAVPNADASDWDVSNSTGVSMSTAAHSYTITFDYDADTITLKIDSANPITVSVPNLKTVDNMMALTSISGSRNITLSDISVTRTEGAAPKDGNAMANLSTNGDALSGKTSALGAPVAGSDHNFAAYKVGTAAELVGTKLGTALGIDTVDGTLSVFRIVARVNVPAGETIDTYLAGIGAVGFDVYDNDALSQVEAKNAASGYNHYCTGAKVSPEITNLVPAMESAKQSLEFSGTVNSAVMDITKEGNTESLLVGALDGDGTVTANDVYVQTFIATNRNLAFVPYTKFGGGTDKSYTIAPASGATPIKTINAAA